MLTRFSIDMDGSMEPDETGQWVRYEDVVRVHTICADVQMLTSEEIVAALHVALPSLSDDSEDAFITGVRVGEKAVRQKAGLP